MRRLSASVVAVALKTIIGTIWSKLTCISWVIVRTLAHCSAAMTNLLTTIQTTDHIVINKFRPFSKIKSIRKITKIWYDVIISTWQRVLYKYYDYCYALFALFVPGAFESICSPSALPDWNDKHLRPFPFIMVQGTSVQGF